MLKIDNLTYQIGGRTILNEASATMMEGWKTGIIGANGAGKSTLFKLIMGDLSADRGDVDLSSKYRIGQVEQDIPVTDDALIDVVLARDTVRADLLKQAETEEDPYKIADIYEKLNDIDAYSAPARAATILTGLGFDEAAQQRPFSSFSGGWRMRVALAAAMFLQPDLLLLDEPTNHLDLEAIIWLETYLSNYPHSILIISHDRELLNICCDHICHVDQQNLTMYRGNYDQFAQEYHQKRVVQQKQHEKQQAKRAHMQAFVDRFRAKATKAKQAQSRLKMLEKMEMVDAVTDSRSITLNFPSPKELPPPLVKIDHADVGYEAGNPILKNIHQRIDMDDRIALLGANGNGKSTLIKLIAGKLEPMAGEVVTHSKLKIGYFSQYQSDELPMEQTPYQAMQSLMPDDLEPKVRAKLGAFGFSKTLADNRICELSGGEKTRLLFAMMSLDAPHILLLDEPTNHLDMDMRQSLTHALNAYEGAVIIVSHDPIMLEQVADRLWLVHDGGVQAYDGDLNDYRKFVIEQRKIQKKDAKAAEQEIITETKTPNAKVQDKKQRAEARKALAPLRKEASALEKKIGKLTAEKEKLEQEMAAPDFYNNADKASAAQKRHHQLSSDIETHELQWFDLLEQIEAA